MMAVRSTVMLLLLTLGCGGGDPLAEPDDIAGWANSSSAFGIYSLAHEPLGFSNQAFAFRDPACPAISDDGTTVVITGGCEDADGRAWAGEVTVVRRDSGWSLTFADFGDDRFGGMTRVTGSFEVDRQAADLHSFEAELDRDGGIETHISYSGSVAGGYQGPTVWNGAGAITRDGVTINSGSVDAETVDQLRDNEVCPGEGVSGTTTMTSDQHTVVISYDGDIDCDDDDAARWSLDGEDQGLVTGVTCAAAGPSGPTAALLLLAAAFLLRRRSRRDRRRRPGRRQAAAQAERRART